MSYLPADVVKTADEFGNLATATVTLYGGICTPCDEQGVATGDAPIDMAFPDPVVLTVTYRSIPAPGTKPPLASPEILAARASSYAPIGPSADVAPIGPGPGAAPTTDEIRYVMYCAWGRGAYIGAVEAAWSDVDIWFQYTLRVWYINHWIYYYAATPRYRFQSGWWDTAIRANAGGNASRQYTYGHIAKVSGDGFRDAYASCS